MKIDKFSVEKYFIPLEILPLPYINIKKSAKGYLGGPNIP